MKVTTADELREAVRQKQTTERDGLYQHIEQALATAKRNGTDTAATFITHGTPQWLIEEVRDAYRKGGFLVTIESVAGDPRDGGGTEIVMSLRLP